jgi:hypothetical protein
MINPPLVELIRSATVQDSQTSKELPALLVSIKPGAYSDKLNLSMAYNITAYDSRHLDIVLLFDNPLQVSSKADPDQVVV